MLGCFFPRCPSRDNDTYQEQWKILITWLKMVGQRETGVKVTLRITADTQIQEHRMGCEFRKDTLHSFADELKNSEALRNTY